MARRGRRRRSILGQFLLLLVILSAIILFDSNARIVTEEYELELEVLPAGFDGFRIVQLSDIHAAEYGHENEKLVQKVRGEAPDIIAVTGDLIDSGDQLSIVSSLMRQLTEIAPVYYVTGNHEWDSGGVHALFDVLRGCGVTVLRNEYEVISRGGDTIVIAGIDDKNGPADMIMPEELIENIRAELGDPFIVLLGHRNNMLERFAAMNVDVVLCGHAHGGIVRLPLTDGLIGPNREWLPTHTSGIYTSGGTSMLVSRGIGNHTGFPRFLNNPHIPVLVLKTAK